jgi:TonB-dependent receptor
MKMTTLNLHSWASFTAWALVLILAMGQFAQASPQRKARSINKVRLSLDLPNITVAEALTAIEQRTEFFFLYSNTQLNVERRTHLKVERQSVAEIVLLLFPNQGLEMKQNNNQVILRSLPTIVETITAKAERPAAEYGIVRGKVTDKISGEVLPGATIMIKGTTNGTTTDIQGGYTLTRAPAGKQTLVVSYLGYEALEEEVEVTANQTITKNFAIQSSVTQISEVVVKASLEGQERALNQQRTSDNIKNIISADVMSRFPDMDATESLQRVPGVNITRSRGQGGVVTLRGTPANFTTVSINGEQIQGTERDEGTSQRAESLDLIPADQLASMEVSKAITPDQDGDAVGGAVNLVTPTAKGLKARGKVEIGSGYNDLARGANALGKFTWGKRFLANNKVDEGRLGILVGGSYLLTDNGLHRVENENGWRERDFSRNPSVAQRFGSARMFTPDDYRYRYLENRRTRTGITATVDYKFSPTSKIVAQLMYSGLNDEDEQQRLRFDLTRGTWLSPDSIRGTRVRRDLNTRTINKTNLTYSLNGEHKIGRVFADWGYFLSRSRRDYVATRAQFQNANVNLRLNDPYTDFATFQSYAPTRDLNDVAFLNSFNTIADGDIEDNRGSNQVFRLNLRLPFELGKGTGFIKAGAKYRTMENQQVRVNRELDYTGTEGATLFSRFNNADAVPSHYMNGQIPFGPGISPSIVSDFYRANPTLFRFNAVNSEPVSASETYDARENVFAAYLMSKVQWSKVSVLAGLRYESNQVDYNANAVTSGRNNTFVIRPVRDNVNYSFLLPNVHVKYSINEFTNLRASATLSYGRPNVGDIVPRATINILNNTMNRGNPDLLPASATNLDLMFERYFKNVGVFSVGAFHKNISQFFFTRIEGNVSPAEVLTRYGLEVPDAIAITSPANGERATVTGVEANLMLNLDFLPGFLKGFNSMINYTYAHSQASTAERDNIRLQGQAEHTANFSLAYDLKNFTIRYSVNHNGAFTTALADNADRDIVQAARTQMDLSASYRFGKKWRVFTEFVNINNAPQVRYQGVRDRIMRVEYFGWWNRVGLTYQF